MKSSKGVVFKRQQRILQLLQENHEMSVEDLSKELEVSEITIRRDLQQFEDQGVIERSATKPLTDKELAAIDRARELFIEGFGAR